MRTLRLCLAVGGFPLPERPSRCVFNLRAAQALQGVAEVQVLFLRAWLPGRRFRNVTFVEGLPITTVALPQLPNAFLSNALLNGALGQSLTRPLLRNFDVLHSVDIAGIGIAASFWARSAKVPHVAQAIGSDVNSILPKIGRHRLIAGWEKAVTGVACNSEALVGAFRALFPTVPNVRAVYRGVDLARFSPDGTTAGPLASRTPVRFLFLGGFPAYSQLPHGNNTKGGQTLVAAWEAVENELAKAGATLLLAGPETDNESIAAWRRRCHHPERVFIEGPIAPEMVPAYLRSADVVMLPSLEEGLPNVALEAAACGRAVFGSEVGGLPEAIIHRETGLLLPAGDPAAWAEALREFAVQPDRLAQMGARGRQFMFARFDWRNYAPQMLELYRSALALPVP
jgi:glycosyltransferase involved in cell wall biosynthesis